MSIDSLKERGSNKIAIAGGSNWRCVCIKCVENKTGNAIEKVLQPAPAGGN